jgi:RNA-directed DNA polymerase
MKSTAISLEEIAAQQILLESWRRYRAGKRRRPAVAGFELRGECELPNLSAQILAGTYRPRPFRLLRIADPKPRLIAVCAVRDRIVQRSTFDRIGPFFEKSAIADSFACRPGRGTHRALLRFLEFQRRHEFLLHLDIKRYFASIDHEILSALLAPKIRDPRVRQLFETILTSSAELYRRPEVIEFFGLEPSSRSRGLAIGSLTSQWWGNLYLDGFDHFVKRQLKIAGYLRYMDDFVLFGRSRSELEQAREQVRAWLGENRLLRLNEKRGHIHACTEPHLFLGRRVSRAGWDLGRKAKLRCRRKLKGHLAARNFEKFGRALDAYLELASF